MKTPMNKVLQHLRRTRVLQEAGELSDGQLLERFVRAREGAALEVLVRRHAPMVWGVCRRVLGNHHDTEDAFQATFLVLVRKAASIAPREMVGNWLYGVAHQTALKARATAARQRTRERQLADLPEPATREADRGHEIQVVLDQELSRLPDKYRIAIVFCDLEGKTRKEAARQLGVPEGTLAARVARGRMLLGKRLARYGLSVSAGALAQQAGAAYVPASALTATIQAVNLSAMGQATGVLAAPVAALTEGVLNAMFMTKVRITVGIALVLGALMLGGLFGYGTLAADKPAPSKDRLADTLILLDKQWWEAASKNDVDTLSKILADDWVGFDRGVSPSPDSPRWTKPASLENYRRWRFTEVKFVKEREVFRIDEHTALMSYEVKWRTEGKDGKRSSGLSRYVRCWVQRDGGWFVKHTECVNLPMPREEPVPANVPVWVDELYDLLTPRKPLDKTATEWKRGVRASGSWQTEIPENAFDGKRDTDWNSGDYAPGWIERDLGACRSLSSIALFPAQDIPGETVHEVWVSSDPIGNDRTKAKLVHTFKGETTNNSPLKFDFPRDLSARYVQVCTTKSPTWISWWEIEIRVREPAQEKVVPLEGVEQKPSH
jgi:RNA polymerase sigma factor (sigma-70 family)